MVPPNPLPLHSPPPAVSHFSFSGPLPFDGWIRCHVTPLLGWRDVTESKPIYTHMYRSAGAGVTLPYSVSVTVVEARGLKRSDIFTADPFAWLRLGGSSHKTNVCRSTRCVALLLWLCVCCA